MKLHSYMYDMFAELCKRHFVMQTLQNPPLYSTIKKIYSITHIP
jgi:hypothetical protein